MKKNSQGSIISGLILILLGFVFLGAQFVPTVLDRFHFGEIWPLIPILIGASLFCGGLFGSAEMLVPSTVVSFVGVVLFYQNNFDQWHFWQLWLLTPTFAGVGTTLYLLRDGRPATQAIKAGAPPMVVGSILFILFVGFRYDYFFPLLFILIGLGLFFRDRLKRLFVTDKLQNL